MRIFNGTAHPINIFDSADCDFSNPRRVVIAPGARPTHTILLNYSLDCTKGNAPIDNSDAFPFPVTGAVQFTSYDPLPAGYDLYIVSNLYRAAYQALSGPTTNLATIDGAVYGSASSNAPVGCLRLAIG